MAPGRTARAGADRGKRHARLPATPARAADLLSSTIKIAWDWNVPSSGTGYVTRFQVRQDFIDRYQVQMAGGREYQEYWIPAEELAAFNAAIVGQIEVTARFP